MFSVSFAWLLHISPVHSCSSMWAILGSLKCMSSHQCGLVICNYTLWSKPFFSSNNQVLKQLTELRNTSQGYNSFIPPMIWNSNLLVTSCHRRQSWHLLQINRIMATDALLIPCVSKQILCLLLQPILERFSQRAPWLAGHRRPSCHMHQSQDTNTEQLRISGKQTALKNGCYIIKMLFSAYLSVVPYKLPIRYFKQSQMCSQWELIIAYLMPTMVFITTSS